MCRLHEIKLNIEFCDAVLSGEKNFEIRRNDRGYQKGDFVKFLPVSAIGLMPEFHDVSYKKYQITYVLNGYGLKDDWVAFGIKEVQE